MTGGGEGSAPSLPSRATPWAFLGIGGILALGYAPFNVAPAPVIALAMALWLLPRGASARRLALLGWCLGFGHFAVALHWIVEPFFVEPEVHGWMAPFGLTFLAGGLALFWAGAFAMSGANRLSVIAALCLAELARAHVLSGFPWAIPSHAFIGTLLYQPAQFVGAHGLFLAMGLLAWAIARSRLLAGLGTAALVAAWVIPEPAPDVRDGPTVRLVQPNAPQREKWDPAHIATFYERQVAATAADAPVDLTLWPETSVPFLMGQGAAYFEEIGAAARGGRVALGLRRVDGRRIYNSAALLGDFGEVAQVYDKDHLVPFGEYIPLGRHLSWLGLRGLAQDEGEGFSRGGAQPLWAIPGVGTARVLICYEVIFPEEILGEARPDMLIVMTNDAWFGNFAGPFQHFELAQARAIEFGLPVLRVANTGISAIIDAQGRVVAELGLNETGHIDGVVPAAGSATLYSRVLDWPILFLAGLVFGLCSLTRRKWIDDTQVPS